MKMISKSQKIENFYYFKTKIIKNYLKNNYLVIIYKMVNVHHTDRYEIQWKDERETKLLNPETGSWVKPTGQIGRNILNNLQLAPQEGNMRVPFDRPKQYGKKNMKIIDKTYTGNNVPNKRKPPRNKMEVNKIKERGYENVGYFETRW